jgi:hypothetical protein
VLCHRADAPIVRGQRCRAEPALTAAERPLFEQVRAEHLGRRCAAGPQALPDPLG